MENSRRARRIDGQSDLRTDSRYELIVLFFAAVVFLGTIASPPSLMDDVDAVQAQIARNMLESGDWVTARLNGVAYLEKSPLIYWMMAVSYIVFGVHDWAARLPLALASVLLCWVTYRFGKWAFGEKAGFYAGLSVSTSIGLFLFTRILIPDAVLTLVITVSLWAFLRAFDPEETRPDACAYLFWACLGVGLLLKGLIAVVIPVGGAALYLLFRRRLLDWNTYRNLRLFTGFLLLLAIAAPWHVLATLRNPPYLDFTMRSEPGAYRGFFWFYFLNEHVLRFLNLRYPRDYNTGPRLYFWLFHLLWLFPWSVHLPAIFRKENLSDRKASDTRLLAFCWTGFLLVFFTFSTTQEYYSMPCYPALALLIGAALASGSPWIEWGRRVVAAIATLAFLVIIAILYMVRNTPAPGDIASALTQNPDVYTLSLGHMTDLTLASFAYLRLPLAAAALACVVGFIGGWSFRNGRWILSCAVMMALFFHAARLALISFDPYLGSRPLARALLKAPPGRLIVDDQYYAFSSVFFYTNHTALLLNGRVMNLEYGSYAPSAPDVFINDSQFQQLWRSSNRHYLVVAQPARTRLEALVGAGYLRQVAASGGKYLFCNLE